MVARPPREWRPTAAPPLPDPHSFCRHGRSSTYGRTEFMSTGPSHPWSAAGRADGPPGRILIRIAESGAQRPEAPCISSAEHSSQPRSRPAAPSSVLTGDLVRGYAQPVAELRSVAEAAAEPEPAGSQKRSSSQRRGCALRVAPGWVVRGGVFSFVRKQESRQSGAPRPRRKRPFVCRIGADRPVS
jgi:hypothetical protein